MNAKHKKTKLILRIIGFSLIGIGGILSIYGIVNFMEAFNHPSFEEPGATNIFFISLGSSMVIGGIFLTIISFLSEVGKYVSKESINIQKDYLSEAGDIHKDYVKNLSQGVKEGFSGKNTKKCPNCGNEIPSNSKFCNNCGAKLNKVCPSCGSENESDANYCFKCGQKLDN